MKKIYHYLYYCFYALIRNWKIHGDSHENRASFLFSFCIAQLLGNLAKLLFFLHNTNFSRNLLALLTMILFLIPYSSIYINKKYFVDSRLYREIRDYHEANSSKALAKFIAVFFMCFSILTLCGLWPSWCWKK